MCTKRDDRRNPFFYLDLCFSSTSPFSYFREEDGKLSVQYVPFGPAPRKRQTFADGETLRDIEEKDGKIEAVFFSGPCGDTRQRVSFRLDEVTISDDGTILEIDGKAFFPDALIYHRKLKFVLLLNPPSLIRNV